MLGGVAISLWKQVFAPTASAASNALRIAKKYVLTVFLNTLAKELLLLQLFLTRFGKKACTVLRIQLSSKDSVFRI